MNGDIIIRAMSHYLFLALPLLVSCSTIFVVEVSRHGARTPVSFQPWDNDGRWSTYQPGELTPEGMRQHYLIGAELRNRYIVETQLLNETFYQPQINAYSTDVHRTLQSAESQMMGLYPPSTGPNLRVPQLEETAVPPIEVYNETEIIQELGQSALPNNTQVVPVHTDSSDREYLLLADDTCERYRYLVKLRKNSTDVLNLKSESAGIYQTIMAYFKVSLDEAESMFSDIVDSLRCNNWYGFTVPAVFGESFFTQANLLDDQLNQLVSYVPDLLSRYAGSDFLSNLSYLLNNAKNQANNLKFQFYSAHDDTLLNILSALQLGNLLQPTFASTLIFELIQDDNNAGIYNVTLTYNDVLQVVGNCPGTSCPLETFLEFINARAFPNITEACMMNYDNVNWGSLTKTDTKSSGSSGLEWYWWLIIAIGILACTCIAVLTAFYIIKKRKKSNKSAYGDLDFVESKGENLDFVESKA
ncbi:unnamed protein product [Blepharisma stoltei]|uniref:Lysosomal acid phosphatase n=1 Tax=Blepharisma stoltei TaxID=1481888 RepID=A0AAU9JC13_9CILI|nr:unnamed protein product [Blepharisma stoltei]